MQNKGIVFSSEAVSEGHPDKIADQISDAVLDAFLKNDKNAHVACEVLIKNSLVIVSGEVRSSANVEIHSIVKDVLERIGYNDMELGLDYKIINVLNFMSEQSKEIDDCVVRASKPICAGDQGIMFGYAIDETPEKMPFAFKYANLILEKLASARKSNDVNWLRPDAKSQITVAYDDNKNISHVDTIVLSTQHSSNVSQSDISDYAISLIKNTIPNRYINDKTKFIINPSGSFLKGGPYADCGLTGRKIIADTYGGYARHGGGAFSGKDPSKVDRSGSYFARYIAKNIVEAKLAKECEVQIGFAIGMPKPVSIYVTTFGTGIIKDQELLKIIKSIFEIDVGAIIEKLNLKKPIYLKTSTYGHFGRIDPDFTWEKTDIAKAL